MGLADLQTANSTKAVRRACARTKLILSLVSTRFDGEPFWRKDFNAINHCFDVAASFYYLS